MDLTRPSELRRLLEAHDLRLSKRFGQNFLIDRNHLMRVVDTAALTPEDAVLEIGPGVGTLTVELAKRAGKVVSLEVDRSLESILPEVVSPYANVTILWQDALKVDLPALITEQFGTQTVKVVANIPYNITSPLLVRFLENRSLFSSITLMVQKEVAERLKAAPDTDSYGAITVFTQFHAMVKVTGIVPRGAFFPPPKVDSAVVHLVPYTESPVPVRSNAEFIAVSRAAFGQRRKTLWNALTNAPSLTFTKEQVTTALTEAGIDGIRRGETLTLAEIAAISRALPFDSLTEGTVE